MEMAAAPCHPPSTPADHLPAPSPLPLTLPSHPNPLPVIAFYCRGSGPTKWDLATGGSPLGNFWPLPSSFQLSHNGISAAFFNSEAAYQSLKWWQHAPTRRAFESCAAADTSGGEQAFQLKRRCEGDRALVGYERSDFDGLGRFDAMLLVLRAKWRVEGFRQFLLATGRSFLIEHCNTKAPVPRTTRLVIYFSK